LGDFSIPTSDSDRHFLQLKLKVYCSSDRKTGQNIPLVGLHEAVDSCTEVQELKIMNGQKWQFDQFSHHM
jgi:hypothetical protein